MSTGCEASRLCLFDCRQYKHKLTEAEIKKEEEKQDSCDVSVRRKRDVQAEHRPLFSLLKKKGGGKGNTTCQEFNFLPSSVEAFKLEFNS